MILLLGVNLVLSLSSVNDTLCSVAATSFLLDVAVI